MGLLSCIKKIWNVYFSIGLDEDSSDFDTKYGFESYLNRDLSDKFILLDNKLGSHIPSVSSFSHLDVFEHYR
jgi:hypothetical protein